MVPGVLLFSISEHGYLLLGTSFPCGFHDPALKFPTPPKEPSSCSYSTSMLLSNDYQNLILLHTFLYIIRNWVVLAEANPNVGDDLLTDTLIHV